MFHTGELAAQRKAGVRKQAERTGGMVRTEMPTAAAAFLAAQPLLAIGAADQNQRMWSSVLTGRPGFLRAEPGGETVEIDALPLPTDPLAEALTRPTRIGAIALDPGTRRRMRINGLAMPWPNGLHLVADQVYGNCPRYIQRRTASPRAATPEVVSDSLGEAERALITRADTFFIATSSAEGDADTSHRGGNPGFVKVDGNRLTWPDYPGNALMMTLGNLEQNPSAGLLFPDWDTGATLQLSGAARVDWAHPDHLVHFEVDRVLRTGDALPLSWTPPEYSPHNP